MTVDVKKMKKIKKFGGGALSTVRSDSVQSPQELDKSFYVSPEMSVQTIGDGMMEPKQTMVRKSIGAGKGFDFGRVQGKIYKTDNTYDNISQIPTQTTKGIEGSLTTPGGSNFFAGASKSSVGGQSYNIGARFQFGGGKKDGGYTTINQDNVVIATGGFADSNYQDYVKNLIEE